MPIGQLDDRFGMSLHGRDIVEQFKKSADLKVDENALARITPPAPAPPATLPGAPPEPNRP